MLRAGQSRCDLRLRWKQYYHRSSDCLCTQGQCHYSGCGFAGMAQADLAVLNDHELDLNTTMMYRHEDYVKAMELVTNQLVALEPLQSKVFPFSEYQQAYEFIDANRETSMKVLIDVQDDSGIEL